MPCFVTVPRTQDGRYWVDVDTLLSGRDGFYPSLQTRHLYAPHCLLGTVKRRYANGFATRFVHPDAVAAYIADRKAGKSIPKV